MRFLIETPNKEFSDIREGVRFENGKAEIEDEYLARVFANNWGYKVTEIKGDKPVAKKSAKKSDK